MENNKAEEIVKKMFSGEAVELSLDDLNGVAGGVITKAEESQLRWGLGEAKKANLSMDDVLALVPSYYDLLHPSHPNVTQQEVIDYIRNNWSSI